ncbi:MAG: rhomboid family intramembrane serine protease [Betaproteobacteria bacterium]|nr:rhomboid family intramembrane serine protease [Betaproteobacteria bacterium]
MIIVPISRKPDWRNPPLVTLLLILVNCLIYFGLQSGDSKREAKALEYYASSSLGTVELPRYVDYLKAQGKANDVAQAQKALDRRMWLSVLMQMEHDKAFMKRLRSGQIVTPDEAVYVNWQRQRERFDALAGSGMVDRFGFVPAEPTLAGLIGHMFLHGSFDHLLGNMAFLFIVGYMVEEALGKRRFLAFYLLTGIGAAGLDLLVNAGRTVPGIGASGAISGVMAMFVVLYGMRRIRFFYWVLIYFDFFWAPAITVLPFWIANELYQFFFNHGSNVNYMAHLGGFLAGAALITLHRAYSKVKIEAPEQEAVTDPLPAELARIDKLIADLRIDDAKRALRVVCEAHRDDPALLSRYYRLARTDPASEDFHQAAALVFALPDKRGANAELLHEVFTEYLKLAKPTVRFSSSQLATLIRKLARAGHVEDADRLTKVLARRAPDHKHLPDLLLLVAECFHRDGNETRQRELLAQLQADFPETATAQNAARRYR